MKENRSIQVRNMKKSGTVLLVLVALLLLTGGLAWWSCHPPVRYSPSCAERLTPEKEEAILSYSRGPYSSRLPLIPLWVTVTRAGPGKQAAWTIHYGLGTVGMTLDGEGLPSIDKPLN